MRPIARVLEGTATDVSLLISIRLEDFAPRRLICLAEALRHKYPDRNVLASIFSAHNAAQEWTPGTIEVTPQTFYDNSKLHGFYIYDKEKYEDYIFLVPNGRSQELGSPFNTRIDLPIAGEPACRLAMNGRCLLEFPGYIDPMVNDKANASGKVIVAGRIGRNGILSDVHAVDAKADSPDSQSAFTDRAIQNLRAWRFEPGKNADDVRITYRFEASSSAPPGAGSIQMRLPDEVIIQTRLTR